MKRSKNQHKIDERGRKESTGAAGENQREQQERINGSSRKRIDGRGGKAQLKIQHPCAIIFVIKEKEKLMGIIITVANQKGGVGKTTTAINMAAALAEKNKKVLLADIDSQGNTTSGLGIEKNELEKTTYELLLGEASVEDSLVHTGYKNLDVLPSNVDMAAAEIELLEEEEREFKLRKILRPLKKQYDFIIVDCPPSLNILTVNAMVAADSILVPIQCEYYALEGLTQLLYTIDLVKERLNPELKIEGILFTMYDARVRLSGQVVQNVKANLNEKIFKTMIPRNVRLAEAPSHGKPISSYAKLSSGTRAYRNFAKELINLHANDPEESEDEKITTTDVYTDDILGLEDDGTASGEAETTVTNNDEAAETISSGSSESAEETEKEEQDKINKEETDNETGVEEETLTEEQKEEEQKEEHKEEEKEEKEERPESEQEADNTEKEEKKEPEDIKREEESETDKKKEEGKEDKEAEETAAVKEKKKSKKEKKNKKNTGNNGDKAAAAGTNGDPGSTEAKEEKISEENNKERSDGKEK